MKAPADADVRINEINESMNEKWHEWSLERQKLSEESERLRAQLSAMGEADGAAKLQLQQLEVKFKERGLKLKKLLAMRKDSEASHAQALDKIRATNSAQLENLIAEKNTLEAILKMCRINCKKLRQQWMQRSPSFKTSMRTMRL